MNKPKPIAKEVNELLVIQISALKNAIQTLELIADCDHEWEYRRDWNIGDPPSLEQWWFCKKCHYKHKG